MVDKICFLFPGQGSQYIGMGKSILEISPSSLPLFQEADDILGFPLSTIMFEGPQEQLRNTSIAQPALFLASAAALELLKERNIHAAYGAGHSLGEYSALYGAGVLSFPEALKLVAARGKAMQKAADESAGTMAALIGLETSQVEKICQEASSGSDLCCPANYNSSTQIVISGSKPAVEKAVELAKDRGSVKTLFLNVSGAFHSPFMKPAIEIMTPLIEEATFHPAHYPVITNVDAYPSTLDVEFKSKLLKQIDHPVRWDESLKTLLAQSVDTFIEVGAGKILSSLMKRLDRSKKIFCTDDFKKISESLSVLT